MRTKSLNPNSSMSLIMENWRGFQSQDTDLEKLDEEYKSFYKLYDQFQLLEESEQDALVLEEEQKFGRIIDFFKQIGETIGVQWKKLVEIFKSNDGLLWKVLKTIGWSLDSFAEIFSAGYKAIETIQKTLFDFVKENPLTGKKGTELVAWIKKFTEHPSIGNLSKFAIAGILLALFYFAVTSGQTPAFGPSLILAALTGRFAAQELFQQDFIIKAIIQLGAGMAIHTAFGPFAVAGLGGIKILRKIISVYKVGKFATGMAKNVSGAPAAEEAA